MSEMFFGQLYFDHNGSGPLCAEAAEAMRPWLSVCAGSSTASNAFGRRAKAAIEDARLEVAKLIHANPEDLVITSGGTEANNLAIKGFTDTMKSGHVVLSAVEHSCVALSCAWLAGRGFSVSVVPVNADCVVSADAVSAALRPDTVLVSIMHSNNEVGTLQPIEEIARIVKKHGAAFMTDAVQSIGKEELSVEALGVDLLSVSSHKFNGPQGVGALYIRKGITVHPLHHGAGHERGIRSGTQDALGVVGMGAAAKRWREHGAKSREEYKRLRDSFESMLTSAIPDVHINARTVARLPNTSNFTIPGLPALRLLSEVPDIAASMGATCHTSSTTPSKVLTAMGKTPQQCASTLRFSLGYGTTEGDIERAVGLLSSKVKSLRTANA